MNNPYDLIVAPSKLDKAIDAVVTEQNAAYIDTLCRLCSGTGTRYTRVTETHWDRHACLTCGGTGDAQ